MAVFYPDRGYISNLAKSPKIMEKDGKGMDGNRQGCLVWGMDYIIIKIGYFFVMQFEVILRIHWVIALVTK